MGSAKSDPMGSAPIILTFFKISLNLAPIPVSVPPVPGPTTK